MAHTLLFFVLFFLFSGFHVSSPSITPRFHAFAEHVGHGGQDRSKIKTGKGLLDSFDFDLYCVRNSDLRFILAAHKRQTTLPHGSDIRG